MQSKKNCENCYKEFSYRSKRRPNARFCSRSCLSRMTKKEQDEKSKNERANETDEEYFKAMELKLEKFSKRSDSCWDWIACRDNENYGVILHRHKHFKAHRARYMIVNKIRNLSSKLFVLHSCDNPPCTNPEHLFLGNQNDNMQDMVKKGRHKRTFLSIEKVKDIRRLLELGVTMKKIAKDFSVNEKTIYSIKNKKSWKIID